MSVSELEQRFTPLTTSQSVWQPWGPAGRYQMNEDDASDDEEIMLGGSSMRRSHSWSGFTSHALRSQFMSDAAPIEGFGLSQGMDESDDLTDAAAHEDGDSSSSRCTTPTPPQRAEASQRRSSGRIVDGGQTWIHTDLLENPDRETASAWRALSTVQTWYSNLASLDVETVEFGLEQAALEYQFMSESTDSTCLSEEGDCSSKDTEVGHWCPPEGMSSVELLDSGCGAVGQEETSASSQEASESLRGAEAALPAGTAGERRSKHNRRGKKASKSRPDKSAELVTTLMVQNLPYALTREQLLDGIHKSGYADLYNFCHLPRTFKTGRNQGFAFLNFVTPEAAQSFTKDWHGNRSFLGLSRACRPIRIKAADMQGIEECEKIAQSAKMQKVKTGTFKPLVIRRAPDANDSTA